MLHRLAERGALQRGMERPPTSPIKGHRHVGRLVHHLVPGAVAQGAEQVIVVADHARTAPQDLAEAGLELALQVGQ